VLRFVVCIFVLVVFFISHLLGHSLNCEGDELIFLKGDVDCGQAQRWGVM